jgi:putative colanic acid biosynthesis UDP-glucose lipid carrier transferase
MAGEDHWKLKTGKKRTSLDLLYLKHWTFWLDVKIVWLTVFGKKTHKEAF